MDVGYNEKLEGRSRLRHVFFPGILALTAEVAIGTILLLALTLGHVPALLLPDIALAGSPVDSAMEFVRRLASMVLETEWIQQALLFFLWAAAGMLVYILLVKVLQIIAGIIFVSEGVSKLARHDKAGAARWAISLNDFMQQFLIRTSGGLLALSGLVACFSFAAGLLESGIIKDPPVNGLFIAASILTVTIGMRIVITGLSLIWPVFRKSYY